MGSEMCIRDSIDTSYNQIPVYAKDEVKMTFMIDKKEHYSKIPFRLKNVELAYQWMTTKIFSKMMGDL